jgi:osmoprotectant transport system permease protein
MIIVQGFLWIFVPAHWTTTAELTGIGDALVQHLILTALSLLVAAIIALPLGLFIGHTGKGRQIAIIATNISRGLPTLGLLAVLIIALPDVSFLPSGYPPNIIVYALLGIPPMLAGAYTGLESVNPETVDAARATGMTELQILFQVEIPLGAGLIVGGIRGSTLQVIATVTVGSLLGQTSLGTYITNGLAQADYVQMTAGAILVAALALIVDGLLALVQRFVVPRGVSRGSIDIGNTAFGMRLYAANPGTPIKEGN